MSTASQRRASPFLVWLAVVLGVAVMVLFIVKSAVVAANATWKPEYATNPEAVQKWFQEATPTIAGAARLGIGRCCNDAERLMTKFVASQNGDWEYYIDPNCTNVGCPMLPIPNDVVHDDEIKAPDPKDNDLPEFKAMRREGVLFIWQGKPSCFWPPESDI